MATHVPAALASAGIVVQDVRMQHVQVSSSVIARVGYDPFQKRLELTYRDGDIYNYFGVPFALHRRLLDAPSIGRFVNASVKGTFRCEKVDGRQN